MTNERKVELRALSIKMPLTNEVLAAVYAALPEVLDALDERDKRIEELESRLQDTTLF